MFFHCSVKSNDGAVDEKTLMKQYRNTIAVRQAHLLHRPNDD